MRRRSFASRNVLYESDVHFGSVLRKKEHIFHKYIAEAVRDWSLAMRVIPMLLNLMLTTTLLTRPLQADIVLLLPSDCPPCLPTVAQEQSNPCLGNEGDPVYKYTDDELKPRICQICPYDCDVIPEQVRCLCVSIGCTKRFIAWKTCRATAG